MSEVIALAVADIHLSHKPPAARAAEPDWYAAMERPLKQLAALRLEIALQGSNHVPILCAGDVFNSWNSCPELVNFAIRNLPVMYAVPGQHDLPHHEYGGIVRSAYWTLVEEGTIKNLEPGKPEWLGPLVVHGFPFGCEVKPLGKGKTNRRVNVALVHDYVWFGGSRYPNCPDNKHLSFYEKKLKGYDVAVFGDNHQPFLSKKKDCLVVNPGCLIPRKSDERSILPGVYLLHDDLSVVRQELDVSQDKWSEACLDESSMEVELDGMRDFLDELGSLDADSLDFEAAVRRYCSENKVSKRTEQLVLRSMEVDG